MSSKTFFGTPRKFCGMCGVVGIKDSPIIIIYYFLFVNKRRKKCGLQGSGSPQKAFSFIITYILLFVKSIWRADVMKVIFFLMKRMTITVLYEWFGWVPSHQHSPIYQPTLANLLIYQHPPICQFLKTFPSLKKYMTLSKISTLVGIIYF